MADRLSKTTHRSIDSCQHNHCVECSHQKPQLRNPHACRLHNNSVEAAVVKTSKGARRRERSSGSIAEPAGIYGPRQPKRGESTPPQSTSDNQAYSTLVGESLRRSGRDLSDNASMSAQMVCHQCSLTGLGRRSKLPVLPCRQIAGFRTSCFGLPKTASEAEASAATPP
jgi:hypothetical protein